MTDSICTEFLNDESVDFSHKLVIESSKVMIMTHYRNKVIAHHAERSEWLKQLETVGHSQEYFQKLLEKLTDSNSQVYKLQAKLATIQDSIFSEKHQTLKLLQENKVFVWFLWLCQRMHTMQKDKIEQINCLLRMQWIKVV